jgi:hypothetical protein
MANEAHVKQLLELGDECTKTSINQIITQADWGGLNFDAARVQLERTFSILDQFRRLPIGLLPDSMIELIISTLQPLTASLEQIRSFSINQENPVEERDALLLRYCREADRFFGAALLYNCLSCILEGRPSREYNCLTCILGKSYPEKNKENGRSTERPGIRHDTAKEQEMHNDPDTSGR